MTRELSIPSREIALKDSYTIINIGTLAELNIDAQGSIEPGAYNYDTGELLESCARCLSTVENHNVLTCIDGRRSLRNADGSNYEVRYHQAGGDLAVAITAIVGGSAALPNSEGTTAISAIYDAGRLSNRLCDLNRSSHLGGCGAANLAPKHLKSISQPAVQNAAKALLQLNTEFFGIDSEAISDAVDAIVVRAGTLSASLEAHKWDGREYTKRALKKNAQGVEILETADDTTHGHHEVAIVILKDEQGRTIDERKLSALQLPDIFVIDLFSIRRVSQQLASIRGEEGYLENLAASLAWHVAVASQLCGKNMPIAQLNVA